MSKVTLYNLDGKKTGDVELGKSFSKAVRKDVIMRAFLAEKSMTRQPYGTDPLAGYRTSAHYHGRRAIRHSMMNREMARTKRIHGTGYLHFTARFVPQATKGRVAHPPKVEKVWKLKVNKKERLAAIYSALSATLDKDLVSNRGHIVNGLENFPIIVDGLETLNKTKGLFELLAKLGLEKELERVEEKRVRAGRGKSRGRKYKKRNGPLIIVKDTKSVELSAKNIPGVDISSPKNLTVSLLAPGGYPGRLTIISKAALGEL